MATHIITQKTCDHPDHTTDEFSDTVSVDVWTYKAGKGRKPAPVRVDLCEPHADEEVARYSHYQRVGDPDAASNPEVRK